MLFKRSKNINKLKIRTFLLAWLEPHRNKSTLMSQISLGITQTRPCNIQQYFMAVKNVNFQIIFLIFFFIFAQNIDCGYTLEPPQ